MGAESGRGLPHSKTLARCVRRGQGPQVLERGSRVPFSLCGYPAVSGTNSSYTVTRSNLKRQIDLTIAGEAVRSNQVAEHHGYWFLGEHGPSFEVPAEVACDGEQATMKDAQALRAAEMVQLEAGAGSDEIGAALAELAQGCVGPRGVSF